MPQGKFSPSSSSSLTIYRSFINGKYVFGSTTNDSINYHLHSPVTGTVRAIVEPCTIESCHAALQAAEQIQPRWYRDFSPKDRSNLLLRAAHLIQQEAASIAQLETEDTGRPLAETKWEAAAAADCLQWFAGLTRSVGGQTLDLPKGDNWGYTRREPLGVTVGIGAWNYPMASAIWKSAPALAFGNTMVFKPSEYTPQTALRVAEIYQHVGIPHGVFNVVLGGAQLGQTLVQDTRVAKVSFTGSVDTGRHIYTNAAQQLKRVTLELGGKSPLILWNDGPLETAVSMAMAANWYSSGQVCSNGTRVFVHRTIMEPFLEQLVERTRKLKIGDPMDETSQIGPLINQEHRLKVQEYIRIGLEEDHADLIYGGNRTLMDQFPEGNFLEPAIFINCNDDMRIVKEEIFGMVMTILPFDSEEEVITRANNTNFGLAAGIMTKDLQRAHRIAARLHAGVIWINNYNISPAELPWGGFKHSGIGSENGMAGVESWTRMKSVYVEMNEMESPF